MEAGSQKSYRNSLRIGKPWDHQLHAEEDGFEIKEEEDRDVEDLTNNHAEKRKSTYGTLHTDENSLVDESLFGGDQTEDYDDPCCTFSRRPPFIRCTGFQLPPWRVIKRMAFNWQTLKVLVVMSIFVFTLWLFTTASTASDAEKVPNLSAATSKAVPLLWDLDPGKPFAVIDIVVTPQEIDNSGDWPIPCNITFLVQVELDVNGTLEWNTLDSWTAQALVKADSTYTHDFDLDDYDYSDRYDNRPVRVAVTTNSKQPVGMQLQMRQLGPIARYQIIFAAIILALVYLLIIFELIHRTIVAMIGAFCALAVLSAIQQRPSFLVVVSWIDYDTLGLLFGMMLMVGILADTGFFEYSAVKAYKLSRGNLWHLLIILCTLIAVLSAFLDNVTTILLLTPVTIRLCKVIDLDPLPIILAEVLFCNIGGTATAIGDPPNILIVNDSKIQASGLVDFGSFMLHMAPGIVIIMFVIFGLVRYMYRKKLRRNPRMALTKEIGIWRKTAEKMRVHDGDEEKLVHDKLLDYIKQLELEMDMEAGAAMAEKLEEGGSIKNFSPKMLATEGKVNVRELEEKYKITDIPLFLKSMAVLAGVIVIFFSHSFLEIHLNLAWTAIIGSMILLLVSGIRDVETVLEKIELGTLMFFAGLFVLMRSLEEMGLMTYIADVTTKEIIARVPEGDARLTVAIVVVIWVSAIASAFIDNIPFTKAMIPVVITLANSDLGLPLQPLVWALAFGCCLGGNGTLIGASANVVAAGLAEQQGYPITFVEFFKVGFPVMLLSTLVATCYMLIFHVVIPWY